MAMTIVKKYAGPPSSRSVQRRTWVFLVSIQLIFLALPLSALIVAGSEVRNNNAEADAEADLVPHDNDVDPTSEEDEIPPSLKETMQQNSWKLDDIRKLLQEMDEAASGDDSNIHDEDDRTLLDIFALVAKEFLTQRVIPDTDADCRWDWRSLRCEPACECSFRGKWGDYHLGRACRRRRERLIGQDGDECENVDPAEYLRKGPVAKRVLSLVAQTADIGKEKAGQVAARSKEQFQRIRNDVCSDLWELASESKQQGAGNLCLPPDSVPPKTIPQRILCGPVDIAVCSTPVDTHSSINSNGDYGPGVESIGERGKRMILSDLLNVDDLE